MFWMEISLELATLVILAIAIRLRLIVWPLTAGQRGSLAILAIILIALAHILLGVYLYYRYVLVPLIASAAQHGGELTMIERLFANIGPISDRAFLGLGAVVMTAAVVIWGGITGRGSSLPPNNREKPRADFDLLGCGKGGKNP